MHEYQHLLILCGVRFRTFLSAIVPFVHYFECDVKERKPIDIPENSIIYIQLFLKLFCNILIYVYFIVILTGVQIAIGSAQMKSTELR